MARDLDAAKAFYGSVLGWEYGPDPLGQGPHSIALADGAPIGSLGGAVRGRGLPVTWTAYFAADDADDVAERIRERGGTVAVGPIQFGNGRVAWAADPEGAVFGVWQGDAYPGWRMGRRPGAPVWLELRTRDAFEAALFYGEVYSWEPEDRDRYDVRFEHDRVILRIAGQTVAGLFGGAVESAPDPQIRPRWHVYFCVTDVDAAAATTEELGGTVITPPVDSEYGRTAALRDPDGGLFCVASVDARPDV